MQGVLSLKSCRSNGLFYKIIFTYYFYLFIFIIIMIIYNYIDSVQSYTSTWTREKKQWVLASLIIDTDKRHIMTLDEYASPDEYTEDYIYLDCTEAEYNKMLNEAMQCLN